MSRCVREVKQWWGPVDGTLHQFDGWEYEGGASIRRSMVAACGWAPPLAVLEMPEEPPPERLCRDCQRVPVAKFFTCPECARVSHSPSDATERYCGACHKFFP